MLLSKCIVCGKEFEFDEPGWCLYTGSDRRCTACADRAKEYKDKKNEIMEKFAVEKELLLKPLSEKLEMDLFLLDKEYLKGKEW